MQEESFEEMEERIAKDLNKSNGSFWSKVARKFVILAIAALTAICGFGFDMMLRISGDLDSIGENRQNVKDLTKEVQKIKTTKRESFALWMKLRELDKEVDDNTVQQRVTQELLQILVEQKGAIKIERISVEEETEEEFQERPPEDGTEPPEDKGGPKKSKFLIPDREKKDPDEWRKEQIRNWEQQIKK